MKYVLIVVVVIVLLGAVYLLLKMRSKTSGKLGKGGQEHSDQFMPKTVIGGGPDVGGSSFDSTPPPVSDAMGTQPEPTSPPVGEPTSSDNSGLTDESFPGVASAPPTSPDLGSEPKPLGDTTPTWTPPSEPSSPGNDSQAGASEENSPTSDSNEPGNTSNPGA